MALGSSGRRYPNTSARNRKPGLGTAAQRGTRAPITILGVSPGDTTVVTLDQVVILSGIPQWANDADHMPLTAELSAPDELTLTYPTPDTTTAITVPFEEPAVRNGSGGYVSPGTFS